MAGCRFPVAGADLLLSAGASVSVSAARSAFKIFHRRWTKSAYPLTILTSKKPFIINHLSFIIYNSYRGFSSFFFKLPDLQGRRFC